MGRSIFRGAPELSRLFAESPVELLARFLAHQQFSEFLDGAVSVASDDEHEATRLQKIQSDLRELSTDRTNLLEAEARRVTAMADPAPDVMLRRIGETARFGASGALGEQRDALARSLWAYLASSALFDAAERAMHVVTSRERGGLYETWSIETPVPLAADAIDENAIAEEIKEKLHRTDGCGIEVVELPSEVGECRDLLLAVTFSGPYASQKAVRRDRQIEMLYFRPPDELLLVYSPTTCRIEVCSRDATERRVLAEIFAEDALKVDLSNKPLTQKTYNLSRFRTSLKLPIPEQELHRVRKASVTEVQVALGDWSRKVSLSVGADDDIDMTARSVFGAIIPRSGGGYLTKVRFHIEHLDDRGRNGTLRFDVSGRNKSNIQGERDPARRALGYGLLEAWGVLQRVGDLPVPQQRQRLPHLLALYDLVEPIITGQTLDELEIDGEELVGAGYLARRGWSPVIIFEDEELGDVPHRVEGSPAHRHVTLTVAEGGSGPRVRAGDIAQFEIRFGYLQDTIREVLQSLGLQGKVRKMANNIHHLGAMRIGPADVPVYLARALSDDSLLEASDRLVRGESRIRGVVFVPQEVRFPYLGCHLVLSIREYLDADTGRIDVSAVRLSYEAAIDLAAEGVSVNFLKMGEKVAQITVPGQDPRIIEGTKKVLVFERLYMAHCNRELQVSTGELRKFAGFAQLKQLFGTEWADLNDRYLHSPRHGYWALCT